MIFASKLSNESKAFLHDFLKIDFLLFYRGKRLTKEEYFETMKENRNEYVFAIPTEKIFIDGSDERSGLARFINDCGDGKPNSKIKLHTDKKGERHIKIVCERPIRKGE